MCRVSYEMQSVYSTALAEGARKVTWNHIIVYKFVLDRNTYNRTTLRTLFVLDKITWYHTTLCKNF